MAASFLAASLGAPAHIPAQPVSAPAACSIEIALNALDTTRPVMVASRGGQRAPASKGAHPGVAWASWRAYLWNGKQAAGVRFAGAGRLPERANLSAAWGVRGASVAGSRRAPGQFDGVQPSGLGQARTTAHEGSLPPTEIAADSRLSRICLWFPQVPSNRPARALRSKSEQMAIQRQPPLHVTLRARVGRWGHLCPLLAVRLWLNRGWRPFFLPDGAGQVR